jgi:DNA-binding NtrC family response regulator
VSDRQVLIIDDEPLLVELVSSVLEEHGYTVVPAASAAAGQAILADGFEGVVLLDLRLPDALGLELLEPMVAQYEHIRVIIMTGHSSVSAVAQATRRGAYDFLTKDDGLTAHVPVSVHNAFKDLEMCSRVHDLERAVHDRQPFAGLIARSPQMAELFATLRHVLDSHVTVMLFGESGTGKELIARTIHESGERASRPFMAINCAGIPENLLEIELFGHEGGAFTGAVSSKKSKFELADRGTIFLDDIGEMPLHLQAKILRVLESRSVERVGGEEAIEVDVRIVSATRRDLRTMVDNGSFREDLYYRLAVFPISLPRLADRVGDVPVLAHHFMRRFATEEKKSVLGFTTAAMEALESHDYPGNVRELQNIVSRATVLASTPQITLRNLPRALVEHARRQGSPLAAEASAPEDTARFLSHTFEGIFQTADHLMRAEHVEDALIRRGMQLVGGNVTMLSRLIGLSRATLYRRISQMGGKRALME